MALESVPLAGGSGNSRELRFQIATKGAWLPGQNHSDRKALFDALSKSCALASGVLHGRGLKRNKRAEDADIVVKAREVCLSAMRRLVRDVTPFPRDDVRMVYARARHSKQYG